MLKTDIKAAASPMHLLRCRRIRICNCLEQKNKKYFATDEGSELLILESLVMRAL
jgi:hypothetical protein